jgi:hypothetical protein
MKPLAFVIAVVCLSSSVSCARPAEGELPQQETKNSKAAKQPPPTPAPQPTRFSREIPATFPAYTPEVEKEIKSLRPGQWIPISIDREYLILRYSGIRLERGPYFVQPLSDAMGNPKKFLLAQKRGTKLQDVDLTKAKAKDGSFAEVLNFDAVGHMTQKYKETRAWVLSSGESGAVWVEEAGGDLQLEGEVMGLASRSKTPTVAQ